MPIPTLISPDVASRLHRTYFMFPAGTTSVKTKAIFQSFSVLTELVKEIVQEKGITESQLSFGCYFGQYQTQDNPQPPAPPIDGKNTIIIHFATIDANGAITMMPDKIYDFGDLRPPKTVTGEQITA